ncbi:MAG TPA: hypothetical protein VJ994_08630 [Paracoccaceae bacterium]|nr:hypothetical protein [Paracoccaceae bacterium]
MKLVASAISVLCLAAVPALAQSPSASPAPPAPGTTSTGGTASDPSLIGSGLGDVRPEVIAGAAVFTGLGIWALSSGGSDGPTSTVSTTSTR